MALANSICCVCGKVVKDVKSGLAFKGKVCYFCSEACRKEFKAGPARFVK